MIEYKYNTIGARGRIAQQDGGVLCETTSYLGRWRTLTPYSSLQPHPITTWLTPSITVYTAMISGFVFAYCGWAIYDEILAKGIQWRADTCITGVILMMALTILIYTLRNWTAEWIIFPSSLDEHRVAYVRMRNQSEQFDEFSRQMIERIKLSRISPSTDNLGVAPE